MYSRKGKLGISWYSDFWYGGRRYKVSWSRVSKTVAKEKEIKLRHEIASGKYESKKKNILFEKLVELYLECAKINKRPKSYERDITSINNLLPFFKGKYLTEIHALMIERYKKERSAKVMPATVNRELETFKNMLNMARKWKMVSENPVKEVKFLKVELKDITILSPEKEVELLNEMKTMKKKAIVITALNTGMRKREILDLTKDNVNFKKGVIHVTHTKNWEVRDIPMNELLTKVLKEVIDKSPYVFPSPKTRKPYRDIKNSFTKAVKKIGLKGFRFHDLRHTWCSRMCELGIPETTIMKIGGWKTRSMINRYSHPSMDHMREALESLNKVPLNLPLNEKSGTPIKIDHIAK